MNRQKLLFALLATIATATGGARVAEACDRCDSHSTKCQRCRACDDKGLLDAMNRFVGKLHSGLHREHRQHDCDAACDSAGGCGCPNHAPYHDYEPSYTHQDESTHKGHASPNRWTAPLGTIPNPPGLPPRHETIRRPLNSTPAPAPRPDEESNPFLDDEARRGSRGAGYPISRGGQPVRVFISDRVVNREGRLPTGETADGNHYQSPNPVILARDSSSRSRFRPVVDGIAAKPTREMSRTGVDRARVDHAVGNLAESNGNSVVTASATQPAPPPQLPSTAVRQLDTYPTGGPYSTNSPYPTGGKPPKSLR